MALFLRILVKTVARLIKKVSSSCLRDKIRTKVIASVSRSGQFLFNGRQALWCRPHNNDALDMRHGFPLEVVDAVREVHFVREQMRSRSSQGDHGRLWA